MPIRATSRERCQKCSKAQNCTSHGKKLHTTLCRQYFTGSASASFRKLHGAQTYCTKKIVVHALEDGADMSEIYRQPQERSTDIFSEDWVLGNWPPGKSIYSNAPSWFRRSNQAPSSHRILQSRTRDARIGNALNLDIRIRTIEMNYQMQNQHRSRFLKI